MINLGFWLATGFGPAFIVATMVFLILLLCGPEKTGVSRDISGLGFVISMIVFIVMFSHTVTASKLLHLESSINIVKNRAIEEGKAGFNQKTGEFEWIDSSYKIIFEEIK